MDGCVRLNERDWWKTLELGGEGDESRRLQSGRMGGWRYFPRYEDTFKPESYSFGIVVVVLRSF